MKKNIPIIHIAVIVCCLIVFSICSCQKNDSFKERIGLQYDSVPFLNSTGCIVRVLIECWRNGFDKYENGWIKIAAYDVAYKEGNRSIYYRRYIVHAFIDSQWEYVGWQVVQDTNYLDKAHLHPEYIELSDCIK